MISRFRGKGSARGSGAAGALIGAAVAAVLVAAPIAAQAAVPSEWVTNGPVFAIAGDSAKTYIGGEFTRVGRRTGHGVSLSAATAAWQPTAEVAGGQVRAVVSDGEGGWYIGGDFTHVGGQTRRGLAHIESSGALDADFVANLDNTSGLSPSAHALYLHRDRSGARLHLYVGGAFTRVERPELFSGDPARGSANVANLAAVDLDTGKPTSWNPGAAVDNTGTAAGGTVHALAGLNLEQPVDPDGTDGPEPAQPTEMTVIFAGGKFTHLGLNPAGGSKLTVNKVGAVWGLDAVRSQSGENPPKPIAGEVLTQNATSTSVWAPAQSGATVHAIAVGTAITTTDANQKLIVPIYIAGEGSISGKTALGASKFEINQAGSSAGSLTTSSFSINYSWDPKPGCLAATCAAPSVRALAVAAGTVYFGGEFTSVNSTAPRERLAAVVAIPDPAIMNKAVEHYGSWNPGADGTVRSLALDGSRLYAAGDFGNVGPSEARSAIAATAAFSADPNAPATVSTWDSSPAGAQTADGGGWVNAVAVSVDGAALGESVFAAGSFSSVGAASRNRLAAFDPDGQLSGWNPDIGCASPPCEVRALEIAGGRVFAGGDFASVGGAARANLAAVDPSSGAAVDGWAPNPNWDVLALSAADGRLYIGGGFTSVNDTARARLAAIDADSGALIPGFDPSASDNVYALEATCDRVFVGGGFREIGGVTRNRIAALDPHTGVPSGWDPNSDGVVYDIEHVGETVYVAGQFPLIGGQLRQKIAALNDSTGKATAWNPAADATVYDVAVSEDEVFAVGFFNSIGGQSRRATAALSRADGAATSLVADPGLEGVVHAVHVSADGLVFGGRFRHLITNAAGAPPASASHSLAALSRSEQPVGSSCEVARDDQEPAQSPPASDQPPQDSPPSEPGGTNAPATAPADTDRPRIRAFELSPRKFRIGRRAVFSWRASEKIHYRLIFRRVQRTKRGRLRLKRGGRLTGAGEAGNFERRLPRRIGKKRLRPGRYRVTLVAVDEAGNVSRARKLVFKVKRKRTKRASTRKSGRRPARNSGTWAGS